MRRFIPKSWISRAALISAPVAALVLISLFVVIPFVNAVAVDDLPPAQPIGSLSGIGGFYTDNGDTTAFGGGNSGALGNTSQPGEFPGSLGDCATSGSLNDHWSGVWYTFTTAAAGPVTITTSGASFDTVLTLWTDASGTFPMDTELACNDDLDPNTTTNSQIVFLPTAGTTYYVRVGSVFGVRGTYTLTVSQNAGAGSNTPFVSKAFTPNPTAVNSPVDRKSVV